MGFSRKLLSGVLGTALLATTASPAFAGGFGSIGVGRGWGNGWGSIGVGSSWGGHRGWGRRHRGGDDTGEVLAGVLIGAVLTGAILSSKNKQKERDRRAPDVDYPRSDREDPRNNRAPESRGSISSENLAVDACASEAESRAGRASSVRDITQVRPSNDGWDVEGVVESRDGYRDRATDRRTFTCSVRMGSIDSFYLEDSRVAMR